jgi:drug/metabolite transporter (DMT)-like permease
MHLKTKAMIYVLICVGLWALIPVVSKLGQTNLDNHQFLFWSSVSSLFTLIFATVVKKKIKDFLKYKIRDWFHVAFLGFIGTYLCYILLYFGYAKAQGIEVLVLQYSWPIFVVVLSVFILKEKFTWKSVFTIILGFTGVFLVMTKGEFTQFDLSNYLVDILVLIAAFSIALFSVLSKKAHFELYTMVTIFYLTATVASFISMITLSDFSLPSKETIIPILLNGIFVNGYSYIFWIKALNNSEASFVAPFAFLTPVLSIFYLILFFHEAFLPIYGFGLLAIIAGGMLNNT